MGCHAFGAHGVASLRHALLELLLLEDINMSYLWQTFSNNSANGLPYHSLSKVSHTGSSFAFLQY